MRRRLHLIRAVDDGHAELWCGRSELVGVPQPATSLGWGNLRRLCPDCEAAWLFATDRDD